jgi:DNA polymerase sigma
MSSSCNSRLGPRNTQLLNTYFDLHIDLRPLAMFLKLWLRQRQLNSPSKSKAAVSFSSYALLLMLVAYLQSVGALPNLQDKSLYQMADEFWYQAKIPREWPQQPIAHDAPYALAFVAWTAP